MSHRATVLLADDDKDFRDVVVRRCAAIDVNVIEVTNAFDALSACDECDPDLAIVDVHMPFGSGLAVVEMLSNHQRLSTIPVVVVTGDESKEVEQRCHGMAAYFVKKSSNTWARLEPLVREVLSDLKVEETNQEPQTVDDLFSALGWESTLQDVLDVEPLEEPSERERWILSIDDDSDLTFSLKVRLAEKGIDLIRAFDGEEGFRCAAFTPAEAILLDYGMPGVNGDYVLRRLKELPITQDVPVIVLTGYRDRSIRQKMLNLGAAAFLNKPIRWDDLWAELKKHLGKRSMELV